AEIDALAHADHLGAARGFRLEGIGGEFRFLGLDLRDGLFLPAVAGLVPGRRLAHLFPHRIVKRLVDLGHELDHADIAHIGVMSALASWSILYISRGVMSSIICASWPINSLMRSLSSRVDFLTLVPASSS